MKGKPKGGTIGKLKGSSKKVQKGKTAKFTIGKNRSKKLGFPMVSLIGVFLKERFPKQRLNKKDRIFFQKP